MQDSIVLRIGHWNVCDFEGKLCLKGYGVVERGAGVEATMAVLLVKGVALPITVETSHCRAMHPEIKSILQRFSKNLVFDHENSPGSASCRIVSARGLNALHRTIERLNAAAPLDLCCGNYTRNRVLESLCKFHMDEQYGFALLERFMWFNVDYFDVERNVPRRVKIPRDAYSKADTTICHMMGDTNICQRMGDYNEWAVFSTEYSKVEALNDTACGGLAEKLFLNSHCLYEGERYRDLLSHDNEYDCFGSAGNETAMQVRRLTEHLPRIATLDDAGTIAHPLPHPRSEPVQDMSNCYITVFEWNKGEDGALHGRGITEHVSPAFIKLLGDAEELERVTPAPCRINVRAAPVLVEASNDEMLRLHYELRLDEFYCSLIRGPAPNEELIEAAFDDYRYFAVDQDEQLLQDLLV